MIIPLSDNLRISGSENDWQLQRRKVVKSLERWESLKYFTKLGDAMYEAGSREIRLAEGNSLADAIDAFSRVTHRYRHLLDNALRDALQRRAA